VKRLASLGGSDLKGAHRRAKTLSKLRGRPQSGGRSCVAFCWGRYRYESRPTFIKACDLSQAAVPLESANIHTWRVWRGWPWDRACSQRGSSCEAH
jgi:hypothetical protein